MRDEKPDSKLLLQILDDIEQCFWTLYIVDPCDYVILSPAVRALVSFFKIV